jgi:hypothetical protein
MKVLLLLLIVLPVLAQAAPLARGSYRQHLKLTFASAAEAAQARLTVAPVYDDREWALSARWDDCNANSLVMHEHMARAGIKGTFYLTGTDPQGRFGEQFAHALMRDGCSIGGHSQTHPSLTMVPPNEVWQQIMANRIEREAQTDTPVNSFAFPNGRYRSDTDPQALPDITAALERAGYYHCVYTDFVKNNPHLQVEEWVTGWQVVPGDKVVDAAKFQENLDKILRFPSTYQQLSRCIFLGVHAWQQGEEWPKFDAVLDTLNNRGWWMCNQTEWAAYARQARAATITADAAGAAATQLTYQVLRPLPAELGAAVPLTIVVQGAAPQAAECDGQPLACEQRGDRAVLNLPPSPQHPLPARIDHVAVALGQQDYVASTEFPSLSFRLSLRQEAGERRLVLQWQPTADLRERFATFRMPLRYTANPTTAQPAAGATQQACLLQERPEERYRGGPEYFAVQLDFTSPQGVGRVYVTATADVDG